MSILSPHPGPVATRSISPGRLLAPERRVVPFVGRTAELSSLVHWCTGPAAVAVRLVSGPRGVGKTRIAREVAQHMAREGWSCLDVPAGAESAALAAVPDGVPGLLVLDRADARGPALAALLRTVAAGRGGVLRILLVARDAGTWFDRLTATDPAVRALLEPARTGADLAVEVLPGQVDARLVSAFVGPYATQLGVRAPRVAVATIPGGVATMLDLQAAALCAVLRAQTLEPSAGHGVLPLDVSDTFDELLEHERWSWFRSAELAGVLGEAGFSAQALDPLVAAATLTGVRAPDAGERLVRRVAAVVPGIRPGAEADIARWLRELDPHRALPEHLVDTHLLAELTDTPELVGVCLDDTGARSARRAALRAVEIVTDRLDGRSDDLGPAIDRLGAVIAALPADPQTLRAVLDALPARSLALGQLRVEVALRTLALTPDDDPLSRGEALDDAAAALTEVGRYADAEPHARIALDLVRESSAGDPDRYGQLLEVRLGHLEALRAAREPLRPAAPNLVAPGSGSGAEALEAAGRSLLRCRRLVAARPDEHLPALGTALHGMSVALADEGRHEAALEHIEESVRVRRQIARECPGRYLPDLAVSLQGVGARLAGLWRYDQALELQQEAVEVWRRLVAEDRRRYAPGLADALAELGPTLSHRDRSLAALDAVREAIRTWRELARSEPLAYRPLLARSLTSLSGIFADLRLGSEAVAPATEASVILREVVAEQPAYRPWLAGALRALALALHDLERFEEARVARAEVEDLGG